MELGKQQSMGLPEEGLKRTSTSIHNAEVLNKKLTRKSSYLLWRSSF